MLTVEEYTKNLKLFKRFLKEKGQYPFMIKYLFGYGRNEEKFYNDVKNSLGRHVSYDFGDILHLIGSIGPAYYKLGHAYWVENISKLSDEFEVYYRENK